MNTHRANPGVLRSETELEVSDPAFRTEVSRAIRQVLSEVAAQDRRILEFDISILDDATSILLTLKIQGRNFAQADRVTRTLVDSVCALVSDQGGPLSEPGAKLEQASQSLVPA